MDLVIKTFVLAAIFFYCGVGIQAQNHYANDPCGHPAIESSAWVAVEGKVLKVIDGNTIIISLNDKKPLLVHLVGVAAPSLDQRFGHDAKQFLESAINGKKIEVWISPGSWVFKRRPKVITGVVYLRDADMQDVNLSLICAGMARYRESQPYSMSRYTECRYEKAEEEAQAEKRGVWADVGRAFMMRVLI